MNEIAQEAAAPALELKVPAQPPLKLKERLRLYFSARPGAQDASHVLLAMVAGALLIALTNAIAIEALVPWPEKGASLRALHHAFDALQTMSFGILWGAFLAACARFIPLSRGALCALYTGISMLIMYVLIGIDLRRQSFVVFNGRFEHPLFELYIFLTGLALPVAHAIGALFSKFKWLRLIPIVAALAGIVVNHAVLRDDYPGVHGAVTLAAVTLFGSAVAPWLHKRFAFLWSKQARLYCIAPAAFILAICFLVPPSNRVRIELFREPGSVAAWALARTLWTMPDISGASSPNPDSVSVWFRDRAGLPSTPPTEPPMISHLPIVVFITVDALRADVIDNAAYEQYLPNFTQLKRTGAYFARATSPGSQTSVSLTTAFSGRYFSQLFWRLHGRGSWRFDYAAEDKTTRFPELLSAAQIHTTSIGSLNFMSGDYGVIRGFETEKMIAVGRTHAAAKPVVDALLDQMNRTRNNDAAFFFTHLTEPHAPYDRGSPQTVNALAGASKPTDFHRYVAEISAADAEIGRVMRALFQRFPERGVLIISSDHGEAFGEHGTFNHTKTLYEELLRVPLFIRGPRVVARRIEQHVGLIDIGPTVLDLFRLPVPSSFMGQSLVPLLQGQDPILDRPILAEGRLRRVLYSGKIKLIEDLRRKVIEAYDLESDPQELHNLIDEQAGQMAAQLSLLRAFFQVHEARAPGYRAPFKP